MTLRPEPCAHPPMAQPQPGHCACGQPLWAPQSLDRGHCEHCALHHRERP